MIRMSENEKDPTNTIIESAKVLLVGAGGIGCEVLKNLVLSGFRHVEVVEDSNCSIQFTITFRSIWTLLN